MLQVVLFLNRFAGNNFLSQLMEGSTNKSRFVELSASLSRLMAECTAKDAHDAAGILVKYQEQEKDIAAILSSRGGPKAALQADDLWEEVMPRLQPSVQALATLIQRIYKSGPHMYVC